MASLRFDPFRELDRWAAEMAGVARTPRMMPVDVYRHGDTYVLRFDLPGVSSESLELTAENNALTVRAERRTDGPDGAEYLTAERPTGTYSRQIVLGDGLDLDRVTADYVDGVLTVTIPVADTAKPRRINVGSGSGSGDHEGHKMISGEVREDVTAREADSAGREPVGAGR